MDIQKTEQNVKQKTSCRLPVYFFIMFFLVSLIFMGGATALCILSLSYIPIAILLVLLCALCIYLLVTRYLFKKIYSPIINIATSLSEDSELNNCSLELIPFMENAVAALLEKNANYTKLVNEKYSFLEEVFLQSRMRDIYVSIDDVEKSFPISKNYIMVYIRIHYKDLFFEHVREEPGKSTFFLKQLIELYFSSSNNECSTFQVEHDQIVSIIPAGADASLVMDSIYSAIDKLENESDYVFFTVVISKPHSDSISLKSNFDKLSHLSRYAMPIMQTQVLVEGEVKQGAGHFYFTIEQMEKFSSLMQNGAREECIRNVDELLDYNIKKGVNGFDLYLLCTEIVNCAAKLLNRLFHTTPAALNLNTVYAQLDRAVTAEQYQEICADVCNQVISYISYNKRDEDYIVSFILDYVESHYAEDIYLNLFSEKLNLTAAYISSYFKEKMNVNLTDYLNSFRIKKAITMIGNPQYKNKDVAEAVGLQNINTFIRLFKKYTGYTPGEYRKKHFSDFDDL